jgi:hypothetical protein
MAGVVTDPHLQQHIVVRNSLMFIRMTFAPRRLVQRKQLELGPSCWFGFTIATQTAGKRWIEVVVA